MKKLIVENLGSIQLNKEILDRFSISIINKVITGVAINQDSTELIYADSVDLDGPRKVLVYDTEKNVQAFKFETEGDDYDIILEIKERIVGYLNEEYTKEGYFGVLVDVSVVYGDGSYHTEPDTIMFIKNDYANKGDEIVFDSRGKILLTSKLGRMIPICKEDLFSVGIIEE